MRGQNWVGTALLAVGATLVLFVAASFLPLFVSEVWGPLWGPEWRPAGVGPSFRGLGPLLGASRWAVLAAVPVAAALLLGFFALVVLIVVLVLRGRAVGQP